ncbi:MAG: hypothetical protein ACKN8Y_06375, partial [Polynucleobacter victoriensis]
MNKVFARTLESITQKLTGQHLKYGASSYAFLFTPILAITLFTGAMGLILWTLTYQDKNQQQYTLY